MYLFGMGVGKRIREERERLNLSQGDIARVCKVTRQAVSKWETGNPTLSAENLIAVARVLNVSPDWLQTGKGKKERVDSLAVVGQDFITVPVLTLAEGEKLVDVQALEWPINAQETITIPRVEGLIVAFRLPDASMSHIAPEGAILIANLAEREPVHNSYYIIQSPDGDIVFRRYRDAPARFFAQAAEEYPTYFLENDTVTVIARVLQVVTDLL